MLLEELKNNIRNLGWFELEDLEVEIKNHDKISDMDSVMLALIDRERGRREYLDKLERQGIDIKDKL